MHGQTFYKLCSDGVAELAACATPTAQLEVWRSGYARSELPGVTMPVSGVDEHRVGETLDHAPAGRIEGTRRGGVGEIVGHQELAGHGCVREA